MKLVSFKEKSRQGFGALVDDKIVDLNTPFEMRRNLTSVAESSDLMTALEQPAGIKLLEDRLENALELIRKGREEFVGAALKKLSDVQLLPPVSKPSKVIGAGMNYHAFIRALDEKVPSYPELFNKTSSALTGHGSPIVVPPITEQAVPEGEVAIIIGKRGKFIREDEAPNYIAGYCCANDISAKNLEFRGTQWTAGKMLETFCPLGPALVTQDEVGDPQNIQLSTFLNGIEIQRGNTSDMVFGIYRLLSEISNCVTLEIGDVILTGTPSDLGEQNPPVFLKHADRIEVIVNKIGQLSNNVIKEGVKSNS